MDNKCFDCTFFAIWDGAPVCTIKMKIQLPFYRRCIHKIKNELDIKTILNEDKWNSVKEEFFKNSIIGNKLKKEYIKVYPEDLNLI